MGSGEVGPLTLDGALSDAVKKLSHDGDTRAETSTGSLNIAIGVVSFSGSSRASSNCPSSMSSSSSNPNEAAQGVAG